MRQTRIRWLQTQDNFLKIGLTYSQLEVRISIALNLTVFHLEWRIQTTATWWCGEAFPLMRLQNIRACCQLSKTTFSNYLKKIVNKEVRQWLFPSFCEQPWSDFEDVILLRHWRCHLQLPAAAPSCLSDYFIIKFNLYFHQLNALIVKVQQSEMISLHSQ